MSYVKIRPRRGTQQQWEYANPILSEGEMAFEVPESGVGTGPVNIKQGDGTTAWNNLPYAFNAGVLNNKVDTLANTVSTYSAAIADLTTRVDAISSQTGNIIKIDVSSAEPDTTDSAAGKHIWLDADMVSGSATINPAVASVPAGQNTTIKVISNLSSKGPVEWKVSVPGIVSFSEIQSDIPNGLYSVKVTGLVAGEVQITCLLKSADGASVVYTLKSDVKVTVDGGLTIDPSSARVIVGKTLNLALVNTLTSFDSIMWTSSAAYYCAIEGYTDSSATIRGLISGTSDITANAILGGNIIDSARSNITIIGMTMDKTNLDLDVDENGSISIVNTMEKSTSEKAGDYDYIYWTTDGANVVNVNASVNRDSATIKGISAGTATVYARAYRKVAGTEDPDHDVLIQSVGCTVSVTGYLRLDRNTINMEVQQPNAEVLNVINTLGDSNFDTITWESSDPSTIRVSGSPTVANVFADQAGSSIVTVKAFKNNVLVASASCNVYATGRIIIVGGDTRELTVGSALDLTINNTLPEDSYNGSKWTTTDSSIVSIVTQTNYPQTPTCRIEGKATGSATISIVATYAEEAGEEPTTVDEYAIIVNVTE